MSVTVVELKTSRELSGNRTFMFKFLAWGSETIDDIADAVYAFSLTNYGFWIRQWNDKTMTPLGGGFWSVQVPYGVGDYPLIAAPGTPPGPGGTPAAPPFAPAADDALGRSWRFEFSSGTVHIHSSKQVVSAQKMDGSNVLDIASNPVADGEGGQPIGADGDGKVQGVDIAVGTQRWTYTTKLQVMTFGYMDIIESLQHKVNSVTFLNRAVGEVLFVGGDVVASEADGFTGTFTFDVARNRSVAGGNPIKLFNPYSGEELTITEKRGWDLLDVRNVSASLNGKAREVISEAWIHQVYDYDDLNVLGLFI
jgi:hypothetical protein